MRLAWSLYRWLRRPSRVALLLGLGALSAAGARADTALDQPSAGIAPPRQGDPANVGELSIRTEAGRIYLSEGGGEFHELQLRDTPEADLLQQLIGAEGAGTAGIRLGPMILAGSGGDGFHWPAGGRSATRDKSGSAGSGTPAAGTPAAGTPARTATPAQATPPQNPGAPRKETIGRTGEKG